MLNQSDLVLTQHMTHLGPPGGPAFRPPIAPRKCHGAGFGDLQTRWSRPTRGTPGPPRCRRSRRCRCATCGVIWCPGLEDLGKITMLDGENMWKPMGLWDHSWDCHHYERFLWCLGMFWGLYPRSSKNEIDLLQFCLSRGMGRGKPIPPKITCLD